jgi:hypothetical protein
VYTDWKGSPDTPVPRHAGVIQLTFLIYVPGKWPGTLRVADGPASTTRAARRPRAHTVCRQAPDRPSVTALPRGEFTFWERAVGPDDGTSRSAYPPAASSPTSARPPARSRRVSSTSQRCWPWRGCLGLPLASRRHRRSRPIGADRRGAPARRLRRPTCSVRRRRTEEALR